MTIKINMYGDGTLYLRPRSPYWWMQYCLRGEIFRESTKERDHDRAMKVLRRRLKEVGADRIGVKKFAGPQAECLTVDQLLDSLEDDLEIREKLTPQARSKIQPLRTALGRLPAMTVTDDIIRDYVRVRLNGPGASSQSPGLSGVLCRSTLGMGFV